MTDAVKPAPDGVVISRELFAFLCGDGPLDGHWFGEKPEHERGNFWWRKALRAADNRMIDAETIKGIILAFIDADDATHWGDFEKALNLAIGKEPMRYREALVAIDKAVIAGRVCDDVAWFDKITTLHDFIMGELEPGEPAVVADLTAHLEGTGQNGEVASLTTTATAGQPGQEFDAGEEHRLAHAWLDENFSEVHEGDFSAADMERAFLAGRAHPPQSRVAAEPVGLREDQVETAALAFAKEFYGPGFDPFANPEAYDLAERAARSVFSALESMQ